jgi:hexosaminidase
MYDPIITPVAGENDSLRIKLTTEISGLELYYRFDGTDPDDFAPLYKGEPLAIPAGASQIRIISYQNGKPVGRQINCDLNDLRRKIRKK